jgi:hypothetical protein
MSGHTFTGESKRMSDLSLPQNSDSPFDLIRRFDADGNECWYARELMAFLGYVKWQRFESAIDRAKLSCSNSELNTDAHFHHLPGAVSGDGRFGDNYKLSRHACHLIAMTGDPRKTEIANAQKYFSGRVREAEVVKEAPQLKALPTRDTIDYVAAQKYLDSRPRDRFTALAEQMLIAEMAGIQNSQNLLPSTEPPKHFTTVMIRANQLGYSAKQIDGGAALGKFVKAAIAPDHKDWQGQYQVWQYEVNAELDARIHSFFLTRAL